MLKENQKIKVRWNPFTKSYYESRGYAYTKISDWFEVDIEDLQEGSHAKVKVICDYCGKEYTKVYKDYFAQHKNGDCCVECEGKKSQIVLTQKYSKEERNEFVANGIEAKYGVRRLSDIPGVKEKTKQTNLERYGVEYALDLFDHHKSGHLSQRENARQKRKNTNLIKYGYECHLSSLEIRKKNNTSYFHNGTIKTSSQQKKLSDLLMEKYNNCELNKPCGVYFLDCAININGINIDVEYDGKYWHKNNGAFDEKRDAFVQSNGYKVLRIIGDHFIPSYEELNEKINILLTTDSILEKIIMV